MESILLSELIDALFSGTELSISLPVFSSLRGRLRLPRRQLIHSSPFCTEQKQDPDSLSACYRIREEKLHLAREKKKPFLFICPCGIREYLHPVLIRGTLGCLIMIGEKIPSSVEPSELEALARGKAEILERQIRFLAEEAPKKRDELDPITLRVNELLSEDLTERFQVQELAEALGYHEKYLGKQFKKKTGKSILAYQNELRLSKAEALLRNTTLSVIEIATRTGFDNVSYFNRIFRRKNGQTPTEYRKRNRL